MFALDGGTHSNTFKIEFQFVKVFQDFYANFPGLLRIKYI